MFVAITVDSLTILGKRHGLKVERRSTRLNLEAFSLLARRHEPPSAVVGGARPPGAAMLVRMDDYVRAEAGGARGQRECDRARTQAQALFAVVDERRLGAVGPEDFLRLCEMQFFLRVTEREERGEPEAHGGAPLGVWDSLSRSCRRFARESSFEMAVLALILSDACLCVAEAVGDGDMRGAEEFWIVLNVAYLLELLVRFTAFGFEGVCGDMIKTTETLVILVSLPLSIVEGNAQGLILLRVVRFYSVLNGISLFRPVLYWIHRIQKATRNAGAYMLVALSALFAFMVLGILCFRDAISIEPSEAQVLAYCARAAPGGAAPRGCDRPDLLLGRACYLAGVSTVPCEFLNPRLRGSAYSRDGFYHINFSDQQSALVTMVHLVRARPRAQPHSSPPPGVRAAHGRD